MRRISCPERTILALDAAGEGVFGERLDAQRGDPAIERPHRRGDEILIPYRKKIRVLSQMNQKRDTLSPLPQIEQRGLHGPRDFRAAAMVHRDQDVARVTNAEDAARPSDQQVVKKFLAADFFAANVRG